MFHQPFEQHPRKWPWILLAVIIIFLGSGWFAYAWLKNITPERLLNSDFVRNQVIKQLGEDKAVLFDLLPAVLGFSEPKTYLVLFLNNTELRPVGGFIGVYATVRIDKGNIEILKLEGTEKIDNATPESWKPQPPNPITQYLKVDRWYFRDSNWSPDFEQSAKKAIELYTGEGGVAADEIDGVIGVTATVLEELLEITGPFTIDGILFESETAIEKLEYEVEYGYDERGLHFLERKKIIEPFMIALLQHVKEDVLSKPSQYEQLATRMLAEKHIMIYTADETISKIVGEQKWNGNMDRQAQGDYLMWIDANLAALKTDYAIERSLKYTIARRPPAHESEKGFYAASATMTYEHTGSFDWRTSRYRTYSRVFVPLGSQLLSVIRTNGVKPDVLDPLLVDQGVELGKQWFGVFTSIEPGNTGTIQFIYILPGTIQDSIVSGKEYTLVVQKQAGTLVPPLTLGLQFDTTITAAKPGEEREKWGDMKYEINSDLSIDREYSVNF